MFFLSFQLLTRVILFRRYRRCTSHGWNCVTQVVTHASWVTGKTRCSRGLSSMLYPCFTRTECYERCTSDQRSDNKWLIIGRETIYREKFTPPFRTCLNFSKMKNEQQKCFFAHFEPFSGTLHQGGSRYNHLPDQISKDLTNTCWRQHFFDPVNRSPTFKWGLVDQRQATFFLIFLDQYNFRTKMLTGLQEKCWR